MEGLAGGVEATTTKVYREWKQILSVPILDAFRTSFNQCLGNGDSAGVPAAKNLAGASLNKLPYPRPELGRTALLHAFDSENMLALQGEEIWTTLINPEE